MQCFYILQDIRPGRNERNELDQFREERNVIRREISQLRVEKDANRAEIERLLRAIHRQRDILLRLRLKTHRIRSEVIQLRIERERLLEGRRERELNEQHEVRDEGQRNDREGGVERELVEEPQF